MERVAVVKQKKVNDNRSSEQEKERPLSEGALWLHDKGFGGFLETPHPVIEHNSPGTCLGLSNFSLSRNFEKFDPVPLMTPGGFNHDDHSTIAGKDLRSNRTHWFPQFFSHVRRRMGPRGLG